MTATFLFDGAIAAAFGESPLTKLVTADASQSASATPAGRGLPREGPGGRLRDDLQRVVAGDDGGGCAVRGGDRVAPRRHARARRRHGLCHSPRRGPDDPEHRRRGARLGGCELRVVDRLPRFGFHFGAAFQLVDDPENVIDSEAFRSDLCVGVSGYVVVVALRGPQGSGCSAGWDRCQAHPRTALMLVAAGARISPGSVVVCCPLGAQVTELTSTSVFVWFHPRTIGRDESAKVAGLLLRSETAVDGRLLNGSPGLRFVVRADSGTDNIDRAELARRGFAASRNADATASAPDCLGATRQ